MHACRKACKFTSNPEKKTRIQIDAGLENQPPIVSLRSSQKIWMIPSIDGEESSARFLRWGGGLLLLPSQRAAVVVGWVLGVLLLLEGKSQAFGTRRGRRWGFSSAVGFGGSRWRSIGRLWRRRGRTWAAGGYGQKNSDKAWMSFRISDKGSQKYY
jgi:hypothetical protein